MFLLMKISYNVDNKIRNLEPSLALFMEVVTQKCSTFDQFLCEKTVKEIISWSFLPASVAFDKLLHQKKVVALSFQLRLTPCCDQVTHVCWLHLSCSEVNNDLRLI